MTEGYKLLLGLAIYVASAWIYLTVLGLVQNENEREINI